jgi:outer membrane biosynthesis protein TonB
MRRKRTMAILMALLLAAGLGVWLALLTGEQRPNRTEIAQSDIGLDLSQDEVPEGENPAEDGGSEEPGSPQGGPQDLGDEPDQPDPDPDPYPNDGPDDLAPKPTPKPDPQDGADDLAPKPTPKPDPKDGPKGLGN